MKSLINAHALMRKVDVLIHRAIQDSWKGGGDPADIPEIEKALSDARKDVMNYLLKNTVDDASARVGVIVPAPRKYAGGKGRATP